MPFLWVNEPPIREVDPARMIVLARAMTDDLQSWTVPANAADKAVTDWNERIETAQSIACDIAKEVGDTRCFVYEIGRMGVGLMTLFKAHDPVHVDYMVTHAATRECGGILIEHAVYLSSAQGFGGAVELFAGTDIAEEAFAALGFVEDGVIGEMANRRLTPAASAKWHPQRRYGVDTFVLRDQGEIKAVIFITVEHQRPARVIPDGVCGGSGL